MEIKGTIHLIEETKSYGNNGFQKRLFVVKTLDEYPQMIPIEFVKDKCSVLDGYMEGQEVTVSTNLRGNEHNGKYYLNLQAWKMEGTPLGNAQPESAPQSAPETPPLDNQEEDENLDLPF